MRISSRITRFVAPLALALILPLVVGAQTRGTGDTRQQDTKILQEVNKVIADHPSFKDIKASVDDQIVTLEGSVASYKDKVRATDKIRGVDHVAGVRNLVNVNTKRVSDTELRDKLAEKLRYDRIGQGITFNNLTLGVNNGVVTVGGDVRSDVDRASALAIVEDTPGVMGVVDNINVAPASIFDDDIRLRVARAIYGHPSLQRYALDPQAPIRIVVENGKVTLYGVVDSAMDRQIAETQARSVPGVFSVTDNLVAANQKPR